MIFAKVSPKYIIGDHFKSLDTPADYLLFYAVPLFLSLGAAFAMNWTIPGDAASSLTTVLAIFAPLLFNVLVLVFHLSREPQRYDFPETQRRIVREVYASTAYAVLVALLALLCLLLMGLVPEKPAWWIRGAVGTLTVMSLALSLNFVLTLFMVLKRMHVLMDNHMQRH